MSKNKFFVFVEKAGIYIVGPLATAFSLFLSLNSFLHTTSVENRAEGEGIYSIVYNIKEGIESVIYYNDSFFLNLIILAFSLLVCFFIITKAKKRSLCSNVIAIFLWTFLIGTVWVLSSQSAPTEDSAIVTNASVNFADNNFSWLSDDFYFRSYSFQLGYVLFNELIIRFVSLFITTDNLLYLEVLNAFFLAVINVFIVLINDKIFRDRRINTLTVFILSLSLAPVISCSFIYGIIPGMMFAIIAIYCEIRYFKDNRDIFGILSALSIAMAIMLKPNYMIWLVAMVLIALVQFCSRKKYIADGLYIALTLMIALSVQPVVKNMYEYRSGVDLGDAVPYASWIAMGLNESDLAPGWYNSRYTLSNFQDNGFDASKASESSMQEIKERIKYFFANPQYANDFFYLKVTSQWNDTAYQSIWNNQVRRQYAEKNSFANWVCGKGEILVKKFMDWFAQLVFFAFGIGCIFAVKRKDFFQLILPLIFLGGFIYQFISEGKSQYIMPYFIVMTGAAAYGIVALHGMLSRHTKLLQNKEDDTDRVT